MSRTSIKPFSNPRRAGFTIVEMVIGLSLSSIILAATLGAYAFLGRNLTRLAGDEEQQARARRTLYFFSQDVSAASGVLSSDSSSLTLSTSTPQQTSSTVSYTLDPSAHVLHRVDASGATSDLPNVIAAQFTLYDASAFGPTPTPPSSTVPAGPVNAVSAKAISLSLTLASGTGTGTGANFTVVSPQLVLRNKPLLGDQSQSYSASVSPTPTPTPTMMPTGAPSGS